MRDFKLKMGPHSIDVNYLDKDEFNLIKKRLYDEPEKMFVYGAFLPPDTICILKDLRQTQSFTTLMHEITEIINVDYDLELNHTQVSTLAEVIGQLIIKNKNRFRKLLE